MAEIVVGAVVTVLIEKLLAGDLMKFARSQGIDSQLVKWKKKLPLIQAVLADAGQKEITQKAVQLWLVELQDLAYDIDDVLDDIATEAMRRKLNQQQKSHANTGSKVMNIILPACCTNNFTPRSYLYGREISSKEVALVMDSLQPYTLEVLSDEISLSLLAQSALGEQNFDCHPSLKLIAQGIVKKCDGLPLALIALGRVLKTKGNKEVEWKELLNSDTWYSDGKSDILPALKLSYYDLPSHLKQLFAYCSLFSKDYQFKKKKLVLLWMAQGYLSQPKGNSQPMESLGGKYFEELLSRSFFQPLGYDESRYIMHDLMNDLAISVAGEFFFRLDENVGLNGSNNAYEKFRHFSFIGQQQVAQYKKFKELHRARCLRTFLLVSRGWGGFDSLDNVTPEILPHLHFLRVLSLTHNSITEAPHAIGNLKHLRYLNLSSTFIKQIPEEVSELYNLQSLLVCHCYELSSLPVTFAKLINLRHFDMTTTPSLRKLPLGIGGLTNLQTLSKVIIEEDNGFKISELKGLKDLQGELSIEGLEKVIDPTEAKDASLQQKEGLDDLILVWGDAFLNTTNEDDVIEKLRPHFKLKTLSINGYRGMKFPSWLGDPSFDELTEVVLNECNNCTELATLGHLTSLQNLEVLKCSRLVSIKGEKEMGSLRQVRLSDCHSLESYCCPTNVERLVIEDCNSMTSLSFSKLQGDLTLSSSSASSNLKFLTIENCTNIKSVGDEEVVNMGSSIMESLRQVGLHHCEALESYCCPTSVEWLEISNCNSMTSLTFSKLQDCPSSSSSSSNLKILEVKDCKNIKSISQEHLRSLKSLEKMEIYQCPSMEYSFPSCGLWPPNLKFLRIGELKKPMSEWGLQNYPSSLVELELYGRDSGVVSFGIMEEQDHYDTSSACFLLPPSLTLLEIVGFEEVKSVSEVLRHLLHLQELIIIDCPKLIDVPETTSSLVVSSSDVDKKANDFIRRFKRKLRFVRVFK